VKDKSETEPRSGGRSADESLSAEKRDRTKLSDRPSFKRRMLRLLIWLPIFVGIVLLLAVVLTVASWTVDLAGMVMIFVAIFVLGFALEIALFLRRLRRDKNPPLRFPKAASTVMLLSFLAGVCAGRIPQLRFWSVGVVSIAGESASPALAHALHDSNDGVRRRVAVHSDLLLR